MGLSSSSAQQALEALGLRLREIRIDAKLTGRDLGRCAGWHSSKVSRIEHGKQAPSIEDINAWCEHCGVLAEASDLIASLRAVEGMFVDWERLERGGLRRAQKAATPLFERTRQFRAYDSWLVPGPLQTPAYTTALLEAIAARRGAPDDIAEALAVRMKRQEVLHWGDHRFAVVIEEWVLRSRIGGEETMTGQLGHLLAVGTLPAVSLGVIPMTTYRPLRPVEGFWIFDERQVNVELVSGWLTLTKPSEVAMYARVFADLSTQAVYGAKARALITAAIDALDGDRLA